MAMVLHPWQLLVAGMAGWINQHQQAVVDYLREENRVLKGNSVADASVSRMRSAVGSRPRVKRSADVLLRKSRLS